MMRLLIALGLAVLTAARSLAADQPFDISLSAARAEDLSPYYRQVIREATEAYRGDFPDGHTTLVQYYGTSRIHYFSQDERPKKIWTEPFISVSLQAVSPNPSMQLTPSLTAFTFHHD
jgi:hypothetical protein